MMLYFENMKRKNKKTKWSCQCSPRSRFWKSWS